MKKKEELFSISELARKFNLGRWVVMSSIQHVSPVVNGPRKKLYCLSDVQKALTERKDLDSAKLSKLNTSAKLSELKLKKESRNYVSVEEVRAYNQRLFNGLQKRFTIDLPRKIAKKVFIASNEIEAHEILTAAINDLLQELRTDHRQFMK